MNAHFKCAPVLLIGFNRPDFMAAQIDVVRSASPAKLYLAVDGPRKDRLEEIDLCESVRNCVKFVDWSCEVKTLFRDENLGCRAGVSSAIDWFFENEESGIILEDDCSPSLDFFRFVSEMLVRYKDDTRIGEISGFETYGFQTNESDSYRFSACWGVWGWASWRRVWKYYDVNLSNWENSFWKIVDEAPWSRRSRDIFRKALHYVFEGGDTWDYQMQFLLLQNKMLTIVPRKRLIINIGIGGDGATHTAGYNYDAGGWMQFEVLEFPLKHPGKIEQDFHADIMSDRRYYGLLPRLLTYLGCKLPRMRKFIDVIGRSVEYIAPFLFRM